jgi:hypothetical protein
MYVKFNIPHISFLSNVSLVLRPMLATLKLCRVLVCRDFQIFFVVYSVYDVTTKLTSRLVLEFSLNIIYLPKSNEEYFTGNGVLHVSLSSRIHDSDMHRVDTFFRRFSGSPDLHLFSCLTFFSLAAFSLLSLRLSFCLNLFHYQAMQQCTLLFRSFRSGVHIVSLSGNAAVGPAFPFRPGLTFFSLVFSLFSLRLFHYQATQWVTVTVGPAFLFRLNFF